MIDESSIIFGCGFVGVVVTSWLWRRAETRYRKADVRTDELGHDLVALAQQERVKRAACEDAHRREIAELQHKLAATEAARKDDIGMHRRGLAELLRLMQAVVSQAERLADGETFEEAPQ